GSKYPLTTVAPAAARRAASAAETILVLVSNPLFEQVERNLRHSRGLDAGHAAMVDRALALQAWAAFDGLANHAREGSCGPRRDIVCRAEHRNGRDTERGGDMHRARIVGQVDAAGRGQVDKFGK